MQLRRWVWLPVVREQALFLLVSLIIIAVLGLFAIPKFPAFKEFEGIQGSLALFIFWTVLLAIFNAAVFFMNTRGDYLTIRSGMVPIAISFLILSVALSGGWALYRMCAKSAPGLDLTALMAGSAYERTRVARTLFVGQGGLMMLLFFSGIWKPAPPETLEINQAWTDVRPLVDRLYRAPRDIEWSPADAKQLRARLNQISKQAGKLITRNLLPGDHALASALALHAAALRAKLDTFLIELPNVRDDPAVKDSFLYLLRELPSEPVKAKTS